MNIKKEHKDKMIIHGVANEITSKIEAEEEKVVKEILKHYLGREVNDEDGEKCVRAFEKGITDKYNLVYDGVDVALIYIKIKDNEICINSQLSYSK